MGQDRRSPRPVHDDNSLAGDSQRLALVLRMALGGNMPKADDVGDAWFDREELAAVFAEFAHLEPFEGWRDRIVGGRPDVAQQRIAKAIGRWLAALSEDPPPGLGLRPKEIALVLELAANSADARDLPLAALATLEGPNEETYQVSAETARRLRKSACDKLSTFLLNQRHEQPNLAPLDVRPPEALAVGNNHGDDKDAAYQDLSSLPLEPAQLIPSTDQTLSPYHLLWPRFGIVPFDDRAGWLAELQRWCAGITETRVAIIKGPGGMGKTRLALELCRNMAAIGWVTGFYRERGPVALGRLAGLRRPRLVIVDYADSDPDTATRVVASLANIRTGEGAPAGIVFLVRRGDATHLFDRRQTLESLLITNAKQITVGQGPRSPTDPSSAVDFELASRVHLYRAALVAFGAEPVDPPDLADSAYATPLFVLLAAVLALHDTTQRLTTGVTREWLLDQVLDREKAVHWKSSPEPIEAVTRRAVAITTLLGAENENELVSHLAASDLWRSDHGEPVRVALWAHELYDGYLWANPLEPDILGERLIARELPPSYLASVFRLPASRALARALTTIARIANDEPDWAARARDELASRLDHLVRLAFVHENTPEPTHYPITTALTALLEAIDLGEYAFLPELPDATGGRGAVLAEVIARKRVEWCRKQGTIDRQDRDLIEALHNWSVCLSGIGGFDKALDAAQEAIELTSDTEISDVFLRLRASLFHTLSNSLANLDQVPAALDASRNALTLRRQIGTALPDDAAAVAQELIAYADRLARLGNHDEAVAAGTQAIQLLRPESDRRPADFATALDNVAIWLARTDDLPGAINNARQALEIRSRLAARSPETFADALSSSLNNLTIWLGATGEYAQSEKLGWEGVELCRKIFDSNPGLYRANLASALNTLGHRILDQDRPDEALPLLSEAVELRRQLYDDSPQAHGSNLAVSLSAVSLCLARLDDTDGAITVGEEALGIRQHLVGEGLQHVRELGISLNNLSNRLAVAGDPAQAIRYSEAAVTQLRRVAEDGGNRGELASALNTYANRLAETGQLTTSIATMSEAIAIRRDLKHPTDMNDFRLGRSLRLQASRLRAIGEIDRAAETAADAVLMLEPLQRTPSEKDEFDKARTLDETLRAQINAHSTTD